MEDGSAQDRIQYRTLPMTDRAYDILRAVQATKEFRKQSPSLSERLTYIDRRTGDERAFAMAELGFLNFRTGMPTKNSSYDTHIYKVCDENGIARFCYVHVTDESLAAGVRQFEHTGKRSRYETVSRLCQFCVSLKWQNPETLAKSGLFKEM